MNQMRESPMSTSGHSKMLVMPCTPKAASYCSTNPQWWRPSTSLPAERSTRAELRVCLHQDMEEVTEVVEGEAEIEEEITVDLDLRTDTEMIGTEEDLHEVGMIEMTTAVLLPLDAEVTTMMMAGEATTIVVVEVEAGAEDVEVIEEVIMMTTTAAITTTMVTMLGEKTRRIDSQTILNIFNQKMIH